MSKYKRKMESLNCLNLIGVEEYLTPQEKETIIDRFEKEINNSLPSDYVDFLINYGGFAFENYVDFPFLETYPKDERALVSVFLGVEAKDTYNLIKTYSNYKFRISSELIPIATDPGGNKVCLAISGNSKGMIYFWDHLEELSKEKLDINQSNLYLIANSFDDFINSLEICHEDDDD